MANVETPPTLVVAAKEELAQELVNWKIKRIKCYLKDIESDKKQIRKLGEEMERLQSYIEKVEKFKEIPSEYESYSHNFKYQELGEFSDGEKSKDSSSEDKTDCGIG